MRKPYLELRGRPILSWTLEALGRVPSLREIVLVTRPEDRPLGLGAAAKAMLPKRIKLCCADGGLRRQDSVFNGLRATSENSRLVLIHDAARPFPSKEAMIEALGAAERLGGALLAQPVRDTIKSQQTNPVSGLPIIAQTVPRARLWQAQTPQVFQRDLLLRLFKRLLRDEPDLEVTDDASVLERYGKTVALIESSAMNIKVTRPEDILIAEAYLKLGLVVTR